VLYLLELSLGLFNIDKDEDVLVFEVLNKVQELPLSNSHTIGISALLYGFKELLFFLRLFLLFLTYSIFLCNEEATTVVLSLMGVSK